MRHTDVTSPSHAFNTRGVQLRPRSSPRCGGAGDGRDRDPRQEGHPRRIIVKRLAFLGGLCLAAATAAGPALAFDNCSPTVHVVYFGSTAVNPTINQVGLDLYGAPLSTCSTDIKTYQAMRVLN